MNASASPRRMRSAGSDDEAVQQLLSVVCARFVNVSLRAAGEGAGGHLTPLSLLLSLSQRRQLCNCCTSHHLFPTSLAHWLCCHFSLPPLASSASHPPPPPPHLTSLSPHPRSRLSPPSLHPLSLRRALLLTPLRLSRTAAVTARVATAAPRTAAAALCRLSALARRCEPESISCHPPLRQPSLPSHSPSSSVSSSLSPGCLVS